MTLLRNIAVSPLRARRGTARGIAWRENRGVTILEILMALVVLGVLATFALPAFRDFIQTGQARSAAMEIYGSLALARSEAVKRSGNVLVIPNGGDYKNGWVVQVQADGTQLRSQGALPAPLAAMPGATLTYTREGRLAAGADFALDVQVSGNANVPKRCVTARAGGQPNVRVDSNKDGNCNND